MQKWIAPIALSAVMLMVSTVCADTIRVDPNSPTDGDGDLSNWSNASHSLADVLNDPTLQAGDVIHVADGVYKPTSTMTQTISFEMKPGVQILGGYAGYGATIPDARNPDPETNNCILSGDLLDDDIATNFTGHGDNSYHVVRADGDLVDESAVLEGFTIRGGAALGDPDDYEGAGIRIDNDASPRITRCRFMRCTAMRGAGAAVLSGTAVFRDCRFIGNHVFEFGGGAYVYGCNPTFVQCRFVDNHSEINGGGLQVYGGGSPRIFNTIFQDNSCDHVGGGLSMRQNDTHLETLVVNCVFFRNMAEDTGGGARVGFESSCRFVQCTFVGNYCPETNDVHNGCGGGLSMGAAGEGAESPEIARKVVIDNCIFWNNQIRDDQAHGSQIALVGQCGGTAEINSCDIMDSGFGEDGIFKDTPFGTSCTTPTFTLTITDVIDVLPGFVTNPTPGIDGDWGTGDDVVGDVNLASGAAVINRGDCDLVPDDEGDVDDDGIKNVEVPWDLARVTRRLQRVDMGAYEYQSLINTCAGDSNGDGFVNVADLLAVINQWGLTGAPSGDVNYFPCGDGVVGVGDLLTVIMYWGPCPVDDEGTPAGAPQTVQDCLDSCAPLGIGTPEYAECVEKCINSLP